MKLAFNEATTLENSTLQQDLVLCEKHGFEFIEIRLDKLKEYLISNTLTDLQNFFRNSSLKPLSLNALEEFTFRNATDQKLMKEDLKLLKETALKIDCPAIVAVPTFNVEESREVIKAETINKLKEFSRELDDTDIRLAFEFVGYPHCSVNTLDFALDIVEGTKEERVGVVFDCFHYYAMNSSKQALNRITKENLVLFHIDDCEDLVPGVLRDHHRLWPGEGVIPLRNLITTIENAGFEGPASVEIFRPEYWELEAEECIEKAVEKTRKVVSKSFSQ